VVTTFYVDLTPQVGTVVCVAKRSGLVAKRSGPLELLETVLTLVRALKHCNLPNPYALSSLTQWLQGAMLKLLVNSVTIRSDDSYHKLILTRYTTPRRKPSY